MLPDLMFGLRCRIIYIDDARANAGYDAGYAAGISAGCPRIWYRNQYTADFCTGGRSIISSAGLTTAYTHIRRSFGTLYPFLEWNHSVQCSASMWPLFKNIIVWQYPSYADGIRFPQDCCYCLVRQWWTMEDQGNNISKMWEPIYVFIMEYKRTKFYILLIRS